MPPARKRTPIVPPKIKVAYEAMLNGATLQDAAKLAGLQTRWLRYQMSLPHVLAWALAEKQAKLELASTGNVEALVGIRDHGNNAMAAVHAAKVIEQMLDAVSERTGIGRQVQQQRQPGLQIVIMPALGSTGEPQVVAGPAQAPLIEAQLEWGDGSASGKPAELE
jgi:hypothetical protein